MFGVTACDPLMKVHDHPDPQRSRDRGSGPHGGWPPQSQGGRVEVEEEVRVRPQGDDLGESELRPDASADCGEQRGAR